MSSKEKINQLISKGYFISNLYTDMINHATIYFDYSGNSIPENGESVTLETSDEDAVIYAMKLFNHQEDRRYK